MLGSNLTLIMVILFFFALYGVIHIVSGIVRQQKCPSDRKLKEVVFKRYNPESPQSKSVIAHLGICQKCRDRIDELNRPKESLE